MCIILEHSRNTMRKNALHRLQEMCPIDPLTGCVGMQLSVYDVNSTGGVQPKPRFQGTVTRQQEVLNSLSISAGSDGAAPALPYESH